MGLVICIGAGPAGLTAGYELVRNGHEVLILEADSKYVGGIARTIQQGGFCFDIGGHRFFSKSDEVTALWKEILGGDLLTRPRKSRIFYGGKFYPYPLDLWQTLANLGPVESVLSALSYLWARMFPTENPRTFEQWVTNQFGFRLYSMFFKTYTEKVWGMPCSEISADWAAQRIKGLSMFTTLKTAFAKALGVSAGGSPIKTLIGEFLYPRKGPGMMWEAAAARIREQGGYVEMGRRVESLVYDKVSEQWNVSYRTHAGTLSTVMAQHVISSMPLRELVVALGTAPDAVMQAAQRLRYRDFLIVALVLEDRGTFDDNWIYVHSPEVKVGRIQNFKAWSPEMVSDPSLTCYGLEYFCFEGDGVWNSSDDALIALGIDELVRIGLVVREHVRGGYVVRQPKAYPVYDRDYESNVSVIRQWLAMECPHLQVVGRNGMHKYNNQDHSMMTAMLAVQNILAGEMRYDVWNVNQDAQYHEEPAASVSGERSVPMPAT